MLKAEVKLATQLRRIVGRNALVALGKPNIQADKKVSTKPHVFLQFSQFCDLTEHFTDSVYTGRRFFTEKKLSGFREERPGNISIHIDLITKGYSLNQELRQKLLGAVLGFLDTLKVLQLSDPKDSNVELLFRDIVPSLQYFSISAVDNEANQLYCGQIHYVLSGFLHVSVKRQVIAIRQSHKKLD